MKSRSESKLTPTTKKALKLLCKARNTDINTIVNNAILAFCQRELRFFADTDGGHYYVGPQIALDVIRIIRPNWKGNALITEWVMDGVHRAGISEEHGP